MRVRSAAPLALAAIVAAGSLAPAVAAPKKKPIKKTYSLTLAPSPDASESTACSGETRTAALNNTNFHDIKVTGPGLLSVKVTGFSGDWDMSVWNKAGAQLTEGGGTTTPETFTNTAPTETLKYKSKKAQTLTLRVCNFAGTPNATVSYTYTYS
ncbi:MAG TPA: hypothetical protein VNQ77_15575 [Frankiaceae bacterium]|nr:hypothetical protein [Frankiaceae bacterium]